MEWLRARRFGFIVLTAVTLALICIVASDYNSLQCAKDAATFRFILRDGDGHYVAAAIIDLVFACGYGLLALSVSIRSRLSVVGGVTVLVGAVADEFENVWLLRNMRDATVTDGAIDLMRMFGTIKWACIIAGLLLLLVAAYIRSRRNRVKD